MSYGICGFNEETSRSKASKVPKASVTGRKVHKGHYPSRGNMDLMDPGEIDQMKYEYGLMRHYNHSFRKVEGVLEGEQVGRFGGPVDFRDHIDDREETYSSCEPFAGGWMIVHGCVPEFIEHLRKTGNEGIFPLGDGDYFFPQAHINLLVAV